MKSLYESLLGSTEDTIDTTNKKYAEYVDFCDKSKELYDAFWSEFEHRAIKLGITKRDFNNSTIQDRIIPRNNRHIVLREVIGGSDKFTEKTQEAFSLLFKEITTDIYKKIYHKEAHIIDWDDEIRLHDGNRIVRERYNFGSIQFEPPQTIRIRFRYFIP